MSGQGPFIGADRLARALSTAGIAISRIPAPATLELVSVAKAPISDLAVDAELLTPTGAAIITTMAEFRRPEMTLERVGYGFGDRQLPWPNALRISIGEEIAPSDRDATDQMTLLETNIDDMNPEIYGYLMEKLFQAGAVDVYYTPIFMKKNRPAVMVSVLAPPEIEPCIATILMTETTTLGLRKTRVGRIKAEREERTIETSLGPVRVKVKSLEGKTIGFAARIRGLRRHCPSPRYSTAGSLPDRKYRSGKL